MFKVALIVIITSLSKPKDPPSVSLSALYDNIDDCNVVLDQLVNNINAKETTGPDGDRMLKLENREYYGKSTIYWSCKEMLK